MKEGRIRQDQKQPKYLSTIEWTIKWWQSLIMKYYRTIKMNDLYTTKWVN